MKKIIKISASWCMSCIITNQNLNNYLSHNNISYDVEQLDYDLDKEKIEKYNIGSILPVYIVFENDIEIARLIGEKSEKEIKSFFEELEND